jgi:hypothetical protein
LTIQLLSEFGFDHQTEKLEIFNHLTLKTVLFDHRVVFVAGFADVDAGGGAPFVISLLSRLSFLLSLSSLYRLQPPTPGPTPHVQAFTPLIAACRALCGAANAVHPCVNRRRRL